MPKNFNILSNFGGFTPTDKTFQITQLQKHIEADPSLADEVNAVLKRKGFDKIFLPDKPFPGIILDPFPPVPSAPGAPPTPTPPQQAPAPPELPALEIDTRLQLLISSIPIANPGNIITSEYHNALRDAVRALASKIGLSVSPTAEFKIFTFAPNFLPVTGSLQWNVKLNQAELPQIGNADINNSVGGGFIVQLPDNATIYQMIARGKRSDSAAPNPKAFQISLRRVKLNKELSETTQQTLISIDLKNFKGEMFEEPESIKLSESEAENDNNVIANAKISDRKVVNNQEWLYFVTAEWTAGAENAARFTINSIQILCTI